MSDNLSRRRLLALCSVSALGAICAKASFEAPPEQLPAPASSIGLFVDVPNLMIPLGTDVVRTQGHTLPGIGRARYTVSPPGRHDGKEGLHRAISANNRMVELSEDRVFVTMTGAIPDAEAIPSGRRPGYEVTGTDSTAAINAALSLGPAYLDPGAFRYSEPLWCEKSGSGLVGAGSHLSRLLTDVSMDRHIGVLAGSKDVTFQGFSMLGPYDFEGHALNRAITIGLESNRSAIPPAEWDAGGCFIGEVVIKGYCTGVHLARADNVRIGRLEVVDLGDGRPEPGSYGVQCSGRNLVADHLEIDGGDSTYRHAVYLSNRAANCQIRYLLARRSALNPWQVRVEEGGGGSCRFDIGDFEECLLDPQGEQAGVIYFGTIGDRPVSTAIGSGWGVANLRNCGGKQVALRQMRRAECGTVRIEGHTGAWARGSPHHLVELLRCEAPQLPTIVAEHGFDSTGLNDPQLVPLYLEDCMSPHRGGLRFSGVRRVLVSVRGGSDGEIGFVEEVTPERGRPAVERRRNSTFRIPQQQAG